MKNFILAPFREKDFFPKSHLSQFQVFMLLKLYDKNQRHSTHRFFIKLKKPFSKNNAPSLFKLGNILNAWGKSEHFFARFWRKTLNKRTMDKTDRDYFVGP